MARSDPKGPFIKLSSPATEEFWKIPILFEDQTLFAVEKPAGLLTSPDRYDSERPNLMKLLHRDLERAAPWAKERNVTYLANAHRLDFETSGVLLLARTKPALVALANDFGNEKPLKKYLAIVHGAPEQDEFETSAKLAPHPVKVGIMRVDPKRGKKSATRFKVLERFGGFTFLECQPLTGRTHQIRVHLQHLRLPLVGDTLYGGHPLLLSQLKPGYRQKKGRPEQPLLGRVALHASQLHVRHPVTGEAVVIESEIPHDFSVALKYLRRFSGQPVNVLAPLP